ncbi:MAG: NAD-dependent epimerase/dehydratase family protein, partial [Solirubrobacteraceae bacterium]
LMRCTITGDPYTVFGYGGKQVRDNIHAQDMVAAFDAFHRTPRAAAVYNIGGGRQSNCSMLEAIDICQEITDRELRWSLGEENRIGDHRWWVSDLEPFKHDYPGWDITHDVRDILTQIYERNAERWVAPT